jgi:hypothetical protein
MKNVSEALQCVNAARAVLALPATTALPAGHRFAPRFNPIARSLEGRLILRGRAVQCDDDDLADRLAAAWGTKRDHDRTVELPTAILTFIHAFDDGMFPELETNLCTVTDCGRVATTVRGDAPMCDRCAEEWESVGPMLSDPDRVRSSSLTRPVRGLVSRIILALAGFFRALLALITFGRFGKSNHQPPKSGNQGPPGSSAAA